MYIRRTTIKSRRTGEPYYTYRLVESVRLEGRVRQCTLVNLGRHFDVPREQWAPLKKDNGKKGTLPFSHLILLLFRLALRPVLEYPSCQFL